MTTSAGNAAATGKTVLKTSAEKATSAGKLAGTQKAPEHAEHDKAAARPGSEKLVSHEKVMEKRRALGRGLDSLLPSPPRAQSGLAAAAEPGPRALAPTAVLQPVPVVPADGPPAQVDLNAVGSAVAPVRTDVGTGDADRLVQRLECPGTGSSAGVDLMAAEGSDEDAQSSREEVADLAKNGQVGAPIAPSTEAERVETPAVPLAQTGAIARTPDSDGVVQLAISLIDGNPHQTRRNFKEEPLKELTESIKTQGVLQPIVVREGKEGRYTLILGERRLRASVMAEMKMIPAIVKRVSEQQAAEMTLVENLQRQDLNCIEQAEAFRQLSRNFMLTQDQIGERVGLSREAVSNYMRLLNLPENVLLALLQGELTFSHARVLLTLKTTDPAAVWYYAKLAIDGNMSVKKFQNFVLGKYDPTEYGGPPPVKHVSGGPRWVDPNVKAAQRSLEEVLGMRVRIRDRAGRGRILIDYATIDDFQRIVEMLGGR